MKFGQPLLTTELSGSIGGATASKARGSVNYFRIRRRPANPRSHAQLSVRAAVTGLASVWTSTLTDVQRAAWSALAAENQSGIDAYIAANSLRLQNGLARVDAAPASLNLPWLVIPNFGDGSWTVVRDGADLTIVGDANGTTLTAAGNRFMGYLATRKQPGGALAQVAPFRFVGQYTSAASPVIIPVNAEMDALLANVADTDKIYAKIRVIHATDGSFTDAISGNLTVEAA